MMGQYFLKINALILVKEGVPVKPFTFPSYPDMERTAANLFLEPKTLTGAPAAVSG